MLGSKDAAATLAVSDFDRARAFYENTLGLSVLSDMEGAVLYRSGGSVVLVYPSAFAGTNKATAASWAVGDDFDAIVDDLRNRPGCWSSWLSQTRCSYRTTPISI